jgi:hypothetical protein
VKLMRTDQKNSKFEGRNRLATGGGEEKDQKLNVAAVILLRARTMRHECASGEE